MMIKLTVLYYKVKTEALLRYHNINEHASGLMFDWEISEELARSINSNYPEKPFIEPFDFENDDYLITEKPFRVRVQDIFSYKENTDGIVEVTVSGDVTYTVKETIEQLDAYFFEK